MWDWASKGVYYRSFLRRGEYSVCSWIACNLQKLLRSLCLNFKCYIWVLACECGVTKLFSSVFVISLSASQGHRGTTIRLLYTPSRITASLATGYTAKLLDHNPVGQHELSFSGAATLWLCSNMPLPASNSSSSSSSSSSHSILPANTTFFLCPYQSHAFQLELAEDILRASQWKTLTVVAGCTLTMFNCFIAVFQANNANGYLTMPLLRRVA